MSKYGLDNQDPNEIRFADMRQHQADDWAGYQGFNATNRNSELNNNRQSQYSRMADSPTRYRPEAQIKTLSRGFVSAISNMSGVSDDQYKGRYLKSLKELNKVLDANKKLTKEMEQIKLQMGNIHAANHTPKNALIQGQMQQLRMINHKLEEKVRQILQLNKQYQEEVDNIKGQKENLRKETQKSRHLTWKLEDKEHQINSIKDGYQRQLQDLQDTIYRLENANTAFKNQQINLKEMYGGKEDANIKKISYLQNQLQETKSQLMKEREKINTEIQNMSVKIRKQTQTELANYKLEMTKLKDINIQCQHQIQKLNKDLRQVNQRRTDKKNAEQRHISELQENVDNCKKEIRRLKDNLLNTHNIQIQKDSLQKQVKMLQNNLNALTEQAAHSRAKANSLQSTNQELMNSNIKTQSQLKKLKVDYQKLDVEIKKKETIINRHKTESESLKSKVVKLQIQHGKNQVNGTRGNINEVQDRIKQLKNKINLLGAGKTMFEQDKEQMQWQKIQAINSMISALEQKMDAIVADNGQTNKRLHHYKEKCGVLQKRLQSVSNQNKVLVVKLQKYQNFVPKLQHELEKAIKQSQHAESLTNNQYMNPSQNLLKDRIHEMNDRLVLQAKYAKQQLETRCLQYDSKLVSAKLEISKLKEALKGESFFHNRITQLSQKLSDAENKKLELIKKVGDLERERLMVEKLPISLQKQLQQSKNDVNRAQNQVQQLRSILIERDRQLARSRIGSTSMNSLPRSTQFQYQKQELLQKLTQLRSQKQVMERNKLQVQQRNWALQNQIKKLKQNIESKSDLYRNDYYDSSLFDEVQKLKSQNTTLRGMQKNLKEENDLYRRKEIEYQAKINNIQNMFDDVYKRLQQALYENTQLCNQNNRLKGNSVGVVPQTIPIPTPQLGKMMSFQDPSKRRTQQEAYLSAPQHEQTAHFKVEEKREYKREFETALFGSRDSDSYEMEFRSGEHYGDYY